MRLTKTSQKYLTILYVIWELLIYYEKFFKLDVPSDATKLPVKLSTDDENITHIIVKIPSTSSPDPYYNGENMKTIFNEYVKIVLLPEQPDLTPFAGGNSRYDIVDCLYVNEVFVRTTGYTYVDIIYVDNMQAFNFVKSKNKYLII